jgi:RimJ/RimL family protein N-acetyltransferase
MNMKYKKGSSPYWFEIPKGKIIVGNKVRLREKRLSDAHNDYKWQSDPELARLDAAPVLTVPYPFYLLDYTDQLRSPTSNRFPFAVETFEGKHIGNCTCYDVNKKKGEAELGIMIGEHDYWDKGYGADAVTTLVNYVFLNTKLRRIHLKTLDWNRRAQKCFTNCGFTPCGRFSRNSNNFVVMELKREQWQKQREGEPEES